MTHQLTLNSSLLDEVKSKVEALPDITTSLSELNSVNGVAATTIDAAIDNTGSYTKSQERELRELKSILEGKAAGGASVETCTVILEGATSSYRPSYYSYTYVTDSGEIISTSVQNKDSSNYVITLENVLCGSVVTVYWNSKGLSLVCEGLTELTSYSNYFNPYLVRSGLDSARIIHNKDGGAV